MRYIYFMRDMPVCVVNALLRTSQIIEEVRKNYVQNKRYNKAENDWLSLLLTISKVLSVNLPQPDNRLSYSNAYHIVITLFKVISKNQQSAVYMVKVGNVILFYDLLNRSTSPTYSPASCSCN